MDFDAEKSRLLNKQHKEIAILVKDVKKKKGAYKEEAQKKLDEAKARHAEELEDLVAQFSDVSVSSPKSKAASGSKKEEDGKREKRKAILDWMTMSKKELEKCCVDRDLGKKGSKEDLVTKLIAWSQEQKSIYGDDSFSESEDEEPSGLAKWRKDPNEESSSEEEEEEMDEADKKAAEEAAKFAKRQKVVYNALRKAFALYPTGFRVSEVAEKLEEVGVKSFTPQICGFSSNHEMFRLIPKTVCFYDRKAQKVYPPKQQSGKK